MESFCFKKPDDWHCHLREGDWLPSTLKASQNFNRVIAMPNLKKPINSIARLKEYQQKIEQLSKLGQAPKQVVYTMFCHDEIDDSLAQSLKKIKNFAGVKLYPAMVTTNSSEGVRDLSKMPKILEVLEKNNIPLLVHAEVPDPDCDPFDKESKFIDRYLVPWTTIFPNLRLSIEHLSTKDGVDFVNASGDNVVGTLTPHHLYHSRKVIFKGGINPHYYCLPILKRQEDLDALRLAATSGSSKFFAGTDSAPHLVADKESACGCAGLFVAPNAIVRYFELFASLNALAHFENFMSVNGASFYGFPPSEETMEIHWDPLKIPRIHELENTVSQELLTLPIGAIRSWGAESSVQLLSPST